MNISKHISREKIYRKSNYGGL